MNIDNNLWHFIAHSGPIVKLVLLILIATSVMSLTIIFQRLNYFKNAKSSASRFEKTFWSGVDLAQLNENLNHKKETLTGLEHIFSSGFDAYLKTKEHTPSNMESIQRAMRIARVREFERLDKHLSFLATVGTTTPYIGLFGTVWGIMAALQALGNVTQASISMVAPGISEALIATAVGLMTAIPARIAYNRFCNDVDKISNTYETFQEELYALLLRVK